MPGPGGEKTHERFSPRKRQGNVSRCCASHDQDSMRARITPLIFALFSLPAACGQTSKTATVAGSVDPASLPARDSHQGLLIAADPYTTADRYKAKFGKRTPYDGGILAIEVFVRNDNDLPIRINLKTTQLLIGAPGEARQRLDPLSPEDVADRVLAKEKDPTPRFPIPRVGAPPPSTTKIGKEFAGTCARRHLPPTCFPQFTAPRTDSSTSISTGTTTGSRTRALTSPTFPS